MFSKAGDKAGDEASRCSQKLGIRLGTRLVGVLKITYLHQIPVISIWIPSCIFVAAPLLVLTRLIAPTPHAHPIHVP